MDQEADVCCGTTVYQEEYKSKKQSQNSHNVNEIDL